MINEIMKRLSELPNVTMDDGQEYIQLYDAMETVKRALEQEPSGDLIQRQAAIDIVDSYSESPSNVEDVTQDIISDIVVLPSVNSQPFEDAISRQAVDELSKELVHTTRDKADFLCNFWEGLQKLPSVNPQEKTGHWIVDRSLVPFTYTCDICGRNVFDDYDYCPYCGAKMVEPQESEG